MATPEPRCSGCPVKLSTERYLLVVTWPDKNPKNNGKRAEYCFESTVSEERTD